MLQIMFLVSLESFQQEGVHGLGFMTFGLAVQKFLECAFDVVGKIFLSRI
jgi:hypothetical protein